jgi:heme-degrading monooxygenase HmoA
MMRARVNLITADPDRMADTIGYIKTSVRPAVDSMDGSLGLSLYANAEIGVAVLESFWASREALIHSEQMAAPRRTDVVRRAVGTVSVERYRVPVYEREAPLDTAVGLRLTRMDVDPPRIEDTVECFGATVVPRLADATRGFCGALLLVDRDTGRSISETMWASRKALAASRGEAAAVRVETVRSTGALIRAVEEYGLVFSTARIGGV